MMKTPLLKVIYTRRTSGSRRNFHQCQFIKNKMILHLKLREACYSEIVNSIKPISYIREN